MINIARVKCKVVISGDIVEFYEYENGYDKGYTLSSHERLKRGRKKDFKSDDYEENRDKVLKRARRDLRRLINSNFGAWGDDCTTKFVTLTFKENVTDLKMANYEFKKFINRLNYSLYNSKKAILKYSVVPEFQKRGAVHYHVVFYNLPFLKADLVSEIWGNGFIKINKIDNVDNLGAYVCKYMTKDNTDVRLEGSKCYFNSRGLFKPFELDDSEDKKIIESLGDSLLHEQLRYSSEFENLYTGKISYKQYNLKR